MITCEPSISVIVAPARSAIERTRSAPAGLSAGGATVHEGRLFQAGGPDRSENPTSETGRWVAAINAACSCGRSAGDTSWNFALSTTNSVAVSAPLPVGYWTGTSAVPRIASFDVAVASPRTSPSSVAKAATKTRPTTFSALVAAFEITAPPYECPTASTGPGICSKTLAIYAESLTTPRSGIAGAVTWIPAAVRRPITPFQLDPSAHARWRGTAG